MTVLEFGAEDTQVPGEFHSLAHRIYRHDERWAAASEDEVERCLEGFRNRPTGSVRGFIVTDRGRPAARGLCIHHGGTDASIGFFEALPEADDAVRTLFDTCRHYLAGQGVEDVLAPKVDNQLLGLQIGGFDQPQTVLTGHHPPYYRAYFENGGFVQDNTLYCFRFTRERILRQRIAIPGLIVRSFNPNRLEEEIQIFHELQNDIFSEHADYRSRTLDETRRLITGLLPMIDSDFVLICEKQSSGLPVGVMICIPDHYQMACQGRLDRLRLLSIGIRRSYRIGAGAMLGSQMVERAIARGFQEGEASWVLSTNAAPLNLAKRFRAIRSRTFAVYRTELGDGD